MKNTVVVFILFLACLGLSFSDQPSSIQNDEQILVKLQTQYLQELNHFQTSLEEYYQGVNQWSKNEMSIDQLRQLHLVVRKQYKKVEPLMAYYDPGGIKKSINGAPLPFVEPKVPEINVIEPVGLQTLDELIFSDQPHEEQEKIIQLVKKLNVSAQSLTAYQQKIKVTHRHVFEATRLELIRIFTLGVTGFDTPGSANALPEARVALEALNELMLPYQEMIRKKNPKLATAFYLNWNKAISFVEDQPDIDFENFDRLTFLKKYINPLYKQVYEIQKILGIETIAETTSLPQSVNYNATNIFDNDFLNPGYFANIDLENPIAEKRAALGKLLFFDPVLSKNLERTCASCHQPDKAFTDGLPKSVAIQNATTEKTSFIKRNSPTLINALYADHYFYDLREPSLERQIKHVVMDSLEFNTDFFVLTSRLNQSKTYQKLFKEAYADHPGYEISKWSISDALANYVATLTSFNSPFDQYVRNENTQLAEDVKNGFNLFMGKAACGTCHFAPTFSGVVPPMYQESESEVLGVPVTPDTINAVLDSDLGRFASAKPHDQAYFYVHSFKTTTVRNIEKTAPYMHNGVYNTLDEVIDFYNRGGGIGLGFDLPHQTLSDAPLDLSATEKKELIAFMNALTDNSLKIDIPETLPTFENNPEWNKRKVGGTY